MNTFLPSLGQLRPKNQFLFLSILAFFLSCTILIAQSAMDWDKTVGGGADDRLTKILHTADGGYLLGGYSTTGINGDKTQDRRGNYDFWIVKLSADSTVKWDKSFGGLNTDILMDMQQTADGGFILGGYSDSNIGFEKSEDSRGGIDYWVVKLAADGTKIWDKTFGGASYDALRSILQTSDNGFILAGTSNSPASGDKTEGLIGSDVESGTNAWLVKISENGTFQWDKTVGSFTYEELYCMDVTTDGGVIIGIDQSGFEKTTGQFDVIKLSSTGETVWEKKYGAFGLNIIRTIQKTSDGGYIMGGLADLYKEGNDFSLVSAYMLKTDADGNVTWEQTLDGVDNSDGLYDVVTTVVQTSDGGYLFGGSSGALAGTNKTEASRGGQDFWVVKLLADGTKSWDKTIGGSADDFIQSITKTADGGYMIGGFSKSPISGEKSKNSQDAQLEYDYWVVKLAPEEPSLPVTLADFAVKAEQNTAMLTWKTTSETKSDHFEVQHSITGKTWNVLGKVKSKGESSAEANYQFVHTSPVGGVNNLYRLKMVDLDKTFSYSTIKTVKFENALEFEIYPNPVSDMLKIKANSMQGVGAIGIFNSAGRQVYKSDPIVKSEIDLKGLSAGLYVLKIWNTDGTEIAKNIVIGR